MLILLFGTGIIDIVYAHPCVQAAYPLISGGNAPPGRTALGLTAITRLDPYQGSISLDSTGYRIASDFILTTAHSIEPRRCSPLLALQWDSETAELEYLPVLGYTGPKNEAESTGNDLMLLRVDESQGTSFSELPQSNAEFSHNISKESLILVGWGKSTCNLQARSVKLRLHGEPGAIDNCSLLLAQVDDNADYVTRGNSGSPVFTVSEAGASFAGIAALYRNSPRKNENQAIGIIPAKSIQTFLSQRRPADLSDPASTSPVCRFLGTITPAEPFILDLNQTHSTGQDMQTHVAHIFAQVPEAGMYKLQLLSPEADGWVMTVTSITQGKMIGRNDSSSISFLATAAEAFSLSLEADSSLVTRDQFVTVVLSLVTDHTEAIGNQ